MSLSIAGVSLAAIRGLGMAARDAQLDQLSDVDRAYAEGVEDACSYLSGDAQATPELLKLVLSEEV